MDAGRTVEALTAAGAIGEARAWDVADRLVRLALLLTGSPNRAHRLSRATLVALGPDAPYQQARRRLLRRAARGRADPSIAALLPGLGGPTPAARLWRRLMGLPASERALAVLTEAEGMADAVAGAALGLPRGEAERILRRVRENLQNTTQLTEQERREVFAGPALQLASGALPHSALRREQRTRRFRQACAAVVVAVVVVVAWATSAGTEEKPAPPRGELPARYEGETERVAEPARWPARGGALGDEDLLHAALVAWRGNGLDSRGTRPVTVWAGSIGGERLVVLAGEDRTGEPVVGALVDRGGGPDLVSLQPSAPTLAVGFTGLDRDRPDARRYLLAPWVTALALNDVASSEPTSGAEFVNLDLADGLSAPWSRPAQQVEVVPSQALPPPPGEETVKNTCGQPLLRLTGPAPPAPPPTGPPTASPGSGPDPDTGAEPEGSDVDMYAVDVGDTPVLPAAGPPPSGAARETYLSALRGLTSCEGRAPGAFGGGLADGVDLSTVVLADLRVTALWNGRLPDSSQGQVVQVSWTVDRRDGDDLAATAFAVVSTAAPAQYSAVSYAADPRQLDQVLAGVRWRAGQQPREYLVLAGGAGVARVDLQPRPAGFRPGGRVAILPGPGRVHAVGVNRANRLVASALLP